MNHQFNKPLFLLPNMTNTSKTKPIYNYSLSPDKETEAQFKACYSEPFVTAAALMPDAHRGYVAPIGAVLITKEFVVPAWVGYDIGCGVIAVKISAKNKSTNLIKLVKSKSKAILSEVKKAVPMGLGEKTKDSSSLNEKPCLPSRKFSPL